MDTAEIMGILDMAEEFRPVIKKGLDVVNSYGPELKGLLRGIVLASVDLKMEAIAKYEAAGFTREEAMFLVMDEWFAVARGARTSNSGKK